MRAFVAVELPVDARARAAAILPDHPALRRVGAELMHLTLAFLGDVPADAVPSVAAALAEAGRSHAAFGLRLDHLGRFPTGGPPRVVWLGVGDGRVALHALGAGVRASLARRAIGFDDRSLQAHVTLARVRERATPEDTRAIERLLHDARVPALEAPVRELVLYESALGGGGPRYTRRAVVALAGAGRTR